MSPSSKLFCSTPDYRFRSLITRKFCIYCRESCHGQISMETATYSLLCSVAKNVEEPMYRAAQQGLFNWAFWNRWTLGLDFGPRNARLWTEILAQNTQNLLPFILLWIHVFKAGGLWIQAASPQIAYPYPKMVQKIRRVYLQFEKKIMNSAQK